VARLSRARRGAGRLTDARGQPARGAPDGSRVYFAGVGDSEGHLFTVRADGTGERAVTRFVGRRGAPGSQALAIDERYLYFTWDEDLGDLWVMDLKK
jgi:hypothetical protein